MKICLTVPSSSPETQGQSVRLGEKVRWKFSSSGGRAPGFWLLLDHLQTVKRMLAPDWAQKMLCIIVPNRHKQHFRSFFTCVRTRRLLSCHPCPVQSLRLCVQGKLSFFALLTRNEGNTDNSFAKSQNFIFKACSRWTLLTTLAKWWEDKKTSYWQTWDPLLKQCYGDALLLHN